MTKRVYNLKRSTHREQYRHMKNMMEFKSTLVESQDKEYERRRALKAENVDICQQIADLLTSEEYDAWWESTPDSDPEFLIAAKEKLANLKQAESQPLLERRRDPVYLDRTMNTFDEQVLAHLDRLAGPERFLISDMLDALDLFKNYNQKHVPDKPCPKCGSGLIVKERRLRQRGGDDYVTNFVACVMFERTGCRYTEPFTDEIKAAIDAVVMNVDVDF